jgi:hypothetical protein
MDHALAKLARAIDWRFLEEKFGAVYKDGPGHRITSDAAPQYAPGDDVELRIRATLAEGRLADLKATLDDIRSQRDNWQAMAQRLAITDQRSVPPPSQSPRAWWWRLAPASAAAVGRGWKLRSASALSW